MKQRVTELVWVSADELQPAPVNPKHHTDTQRTAISEALERFGFAGALLAYRRSDGKLGLVDGHLRQEAVGNTKVPVLVTDLTEDEVVAMVSAYDEIGKLSERDHALLAECVERLKQYSPALVDLLKLAEPPSFRQVLNLKPPPQIVWILLGVPLERYGEASEHIANLEKLADITVQTTGMREQKQT